MDIHRIYEELGRADAAACESRADWDRAEEAMRVERSALSKRHDALRVEKRHQHDRNMVRLLALREVIKQVQQGVDPLVAKLSCDSTVAEACDLLDAQLAHIDIDDDVEELYDEIAKVDP